MRITAVETHVCHARMRNWIFVGSSPTRTACGAGARRRSNGTRARWSARSRTSRIARRRGPDAHRAPVADDVPPALLARQRHRARDGDLRHRHRPVGHPRQGARRALPQTLGRPGARLHPPVLPPRRRARWRTSTSAGDATGFAELARQAVEEGFTAFKAMAVPPTMPIEGLQPIRTPRRASPPCARRSATTSTSWSIATPARRPRWGCSSRRRSSRTGCTFSRSRAGPRATDDLAAIQRAVTTPIATGERLIGLQAFRELLDARGASVMQPDITHCGGLTRGAPHRRVGRGAIASRWRRTTRRGRSAPRLRWSWASRRRATSSAKRSTRTCPGAQDVVSEGFTVERDGPHRAAEPAARARHRDQPRRRARPSLRAGGAARDHLRGRRRRRLVSARRARQHVPAVELLAVRIARAHRAALVLELPVALRAGAVP